MPTRLLALHLIRPDTDACDDDRVHFENVPSLPDMVKIHVIYADTGTELKSGFTRSFVVARANAYEYAMTLVGSLIRDDDPFEKLQVSSAIFPTVLYRVEDLNDDDVRTAIQNIVYSTFNTSIS